MSTGRWNRSNPSIRRIFADILELKTDPSDQYAAEPTEENLFDWHFVIRGPAGTDFEGGVYHGRIILPGDYPFKPPSIMFFTPNGRWEVKSKICLSISQYHPEMWQPAWGIRTILEALISFMTTAGDGAIGALDYSPEERRKLAKASLSYQHKRMPTLPSLGTAPTKDSTKNRYVEQISQMCIVDPTNSADDDKQDQNLDQSDQKVSQGHEELQATENSSAPKDHSSSPKDSVADANNESSVTPAENELGTEPSSSVSSDSTAVRRGDSNRGYRLLNIAIFLSIVTLAIFLRKLQNKVVGMD